MIVETYSPHCPGFLKAYLAVNHFFVLSSKVSLTLKYLQVTFYTAAILYFGRALFIPLFFSLLVAIVLYPMCARLERNKWPKSLAIAAALSIVAVLAGLLMGLFFWQLQVFRTEIP